MIDSDFICLLERSRIPKGTRIERHYLEARKWAGTVARDSSEYERLVKIAAKYVEV